MIITETQGVYTHTYSDTYLIRKVGTEEICAGAYEPEPSEWEETDTKLPPSPEGMREALSILGVQT